MTLKSLIRRIHVSAQLLWQLIRVNIQLVRGLWRISRLKQPVISIFGGSHVIVTDKYAKMANQLAHMCVEAGISVLTGGGPGIMEAASCGAQIHGKQLPGYGGSIGIGVKRLQEHRNPCVQEYFEVDYFFARKWLLTQYSGGFAVFPGGFGTLDELAEVLVLIQTKKMPKIPIILIGTEYWQGLHHWVKNEVYHQHSLVTEEDLQLFTTTDDINEVFRILREQNVIVVKDHRSTVSHRHNKR